jgi:hypothetical protein
MPNYILTLIKEPQYESAQLSWHYYKDYRVDFWDELCYFISYS